jgi:hypothetical protein
LEGFTLLDYVFLAIGAFGILFCLYHHIAIKPKSIKRQKELNQIYRKEINEIVKSIKGED